MVHINQVKGKKIIQFSSQIMIHFLMHKNDTMQSQLLTFSSKLRSAADLQRTVALAPRKNVTAKMRFRKKALKKYRPTTLRKKVRGTPS